MTNINLIEHCMSTCSDIPDETIQKVLFNCAKTNSNKCTKCALLQYKAGEGCSTKLAKLSLVLIQRLKNSLS